MTLHEQAEYREMNVIGVDVSKAKLDCAWFSATQKIKTKSVSNQPEGWQQLMDWARQKNGCPINEWLFVLEATGVYHENVATWPHDQGAQVSVVNPAHVKHYAQSLGVQTKNDKKDSVVLARYGQRERPGLWHPAAPEIRLVKGASGTFVCARKGLTT